MEDPYELFNPVIKEATLTLESRYLRLAYERPGAFPQDKLHGARDAR